MPPDPVAEIGVFGGSGFYSFLDDVEEVAVETPYGPPSGRFHIGDVGGRRVAFLARHGPNHELPPHRINYRANVWAMRSLGVRRVLSPCAVGSLQPRVKPGELVICDQLVDRTRGREDTYVEGPAVASIPFADPYCEELRAAAIGAARDERIRAHERGTVVVIQGPRFSTRAESAWFRGQGWQVINMTQYPEAALARELGVCFAGIALVTDYDAGLDEEAGVEPVTMEKVFEVLEANLDRVRRLLFRAIPAIPPERRCACGEAIDPSVLPT